MKSPPISLLSGCIAAALVLCLFAGVCAGPGWTAPPCRRQQLQKRLAEVKQRLGKLKAGQAGKSPTPALAAKLERSGETGNKPSSTNKRSTVKWVNGNAPKVRQNIRNAASNITAAR